MTVSETLSEQETTNDLGCEFHFKQTCLVCYEKYNEFIFIIKQ